MSMKITVPAIERENITLAELPILRAIIKSFKVSEENLTDYALTALKMASAKCKSNYYKPEILKATASIARNKRIWNQLYCGDCESRDFDVWVEVLAKCDNDFYEIGICLTDIWSENSEHMYIRVFKQAMEIF